MGLMFRVGFGADAAHPMARQTTTTNPTKVLHMGTSLRDRSGLLATATDDSNDHKGASCSVVRSCWSFDRLSWLLWRPDYPREGKLGQHAANMVSTCPNKASLVPRSASR